ncbi:MAG: Dolichol monophosphate mannose synthase [Bryobacterales bacterium]|nr:Dolichol monophosphate mannose synthase [Bryobacterales bacterium]
MPELAVVAPTYNEAENVRPLLDVLEVALVGIDFEVIFVDDDSPDGTADVVRSISQRSPHVRILQRINRRGLASAAVEGAMASSAPYVAVIDADLQHDERILPVMLARMKTNNLDLVIGSRNVGDGSMGEFSANRVRLSSFGRWLSGIACKASISDPMSGFFIVRREYLEEVVRSMSNRGFKILVDLVASSERPVRFEEVGYTFRNRIHGESKLDITVGIEFIELLLDKKFGRFVPVNYLMFAGVGSAGVLLHLAIMTALLRPGLSFATAQVISSSIVIAFNFMLNNLVTFRSARLRGIQFVRSFLIFYVACIIGLVTNVELARFLQANGLQWYLASAFALFVGSVWNYWISEIFVWRVSQRRKRLRAREVTRRAEPIEAELN